MYKLISFLFLAVLFVACNDKSAENPDKKTNTEASAGAPQFFGEKITEEGAVPTDSLAALMGQDTMKNCKLSGTIDAVCQKKGCWMELKNASGANIRVTFKDYAFFMPKDASGKTAIVDGFGKVEVTSVADLQEYAKDDGKSKEEIAAIKEPLKELVFEAKGVILK